MEVFDHSYFMALLLNIILFYRWGGLKTRVKFLQQQYIFWKKKKQISRKSLEFTEPEGGLTQLYLEQNFKRYLDIYRQD